MKNNQAVELPLTIDLKRGKPVKGVHDQPNHFQKRRLSDGMPTQEQKKSSKIQLLP